LFDMVKLNCTNTSPVKAHTQKRSIVNAFMFKICFKWFCLIIVLAQKKAVRIFGGVPHR
jgi:hypothetical protein